MRKLQLNPIQQLWFERGLQIVITFTITIFIQEWFRYPFAPYTGFVVMMIFIGFDVGMVKDRGRHRFYGALLCGLAGFLYWYLGHLNYRAILILIVIWVFCYIYFLNHAYLTGTFFTMSLTLIGKGYLDTQGKVYATEMISDIFISTVFAYIIIMFMHEWLFKDKRLSFQIFYHMLTNFLQNIRACEDLCDQKAHISLQWHHTYEQVLNEFNILQDYAKMNESLIIPFMPKHDLDEFIQTSQDYYMALALKVASRKNPEYVHHSPYRQLAAILARNNYEA